MFRNDKFSMLVALSKKSVKALHDSFFINIYISVKKLQYDFTSYTTLQDYYTIQIYSTTETMPRGAKDYPDANGKHRLKLLSTSNCMPRVFMILYWCTISLQLFS